MGAGQALTAEITFQDGRAQQDNFDTYLIPRMGDRAAGDQRASRVLGRL
ncbi:hypothetical protein [Paracoccus sp. NBH48]|nr:hypothetical protein [Paracoccus sp. NBH48]